MPNHTGWSSDVPTREWAAEEQKRDKERDKEVKRLENMMDKYLADHPSASYAEAFNSTWETY